ARLSYLTASWLSTAPLLAGYCRAQAGGNPTADNQPPFERAVAVVRLDAEHTLDPCRPYEREHGKKARDRRRGRLPPKPKSEPRPHRASPRSVAQPGHGSSSRSWPPSSSSSSSSLQQSSASPSQHCSHRHRSHPHFLQSPPQCLQSHRSQIVYAIASSALTGVVESSLVMISSDAIGHFSVAL